MLPFPIIKQLPNKKENNKYNKYKAIQRNISKRQLNQLKQLSFKQQIHLIDLTIQLHTNN